MRGCGILMIALLAGARTGAHGQAPAVRGDRFGAFAERLAAIADSAARERAVDTLVARVRDSGTVLRGDSTATFLYRGPGRRIFVAGDANGWNPAAGEMRRVAGTSLFALTWRLDPAARCEYKIVVDSAWMLDPLNTLTVRGGFGDNSELRMPGYLRGCAPGDWIQSSSRATGSGGISTRSSIPPPRTPLPGHRSPSGMSRTAGNSLSLPG